MSERIKLLHFSERRVERFEGTGYAQLKDQMKPVGIWLSVGRSWQRWCEAEDFAIERLKYIHHVMVNQDQVLRLKSADDIDRFTKDYSYRFALSNNRSIDWGKVAQWYAGILIAPYCWQRRLTFHTSWYYTWDCASACIWDLSAIEGIECREAK